MNSKLQGVSLLILGLAAVWGFLAQRDAAEQLATLESQVASLRASLTEASASALADRVAELETARAVRSAEPPKAPSPRSKPGGADLTGSTPQKIAELKDALRSEMATMVEAKSDQARVAKRDERRARWREGALHSVADFVNDRELDEETAEKVTAYMERSIGDGMAQWAKVEAQEMSFYEFRKEMKKARKAFEDEMASLLSDEDYTALIEAFPAKF